MEPENSVGAADMARRLRRDARRDGLGSRLWAGWELELTAKPEGEWELSVKWRGEYPIESGRERIKMLITAFEVPELHRYAVEIVIKQPHPQWTTRWRDT